MKKRNLCLFAKSALGLLLIGLTAHAAEPKKILVVTTTVGFRHSSIGTAEQVLAKLADENRLFTLDYARQPEHQPNAPQKPKNATPQDLESLRRKKPNTKRPMR